MAQSHVAPAPLITRPFVLAAAAHFLFSLSYHLHLHLPGFFKQLGAEEVVIGIVFGMTGGVAIVARPLMGKIMDERGRIPIILAGGALETVVCSLYLGVDKIGPLLIIARLGHGLASAMLFASLFAFASDIVPAGRRIQGIALFGISGMLPMAIGGAMGDVILESSGYPMLFATSVGCSMFAFLLSLPLSEPPRPADYQPPRGIWAALVQRDLVPLWFAGTVFATALMAHFTFLKTYVMSTGVGSVGSFFSVYAISAVVLRLFGSGLPERVGPKRVLFPAMAVTALGFLVLARAHHPYEVLAAGALCGLGHGFTFPILLGMVVTRARSSERGAALSIFTALFDLGMVLGAPVLGLVIQLTDYATMFLTAALMVVAGSLIFASWDRNATSEGAPAAH